MIGIRRSTSIAESAIGNVDRRFVLSASGTSARRFVRCSTSSGRRSPGDTRISARVVGIATRRHGQACRRRDGRRRRRPRPDCERTADDTLAFLRDALRRSAAAAARERPPGRRRDDDARHRDAASRRSTTSAPRSPAARTSITANKGPVAFAYAPLRRAARARRSPVPVRGRGDGRRADLQSRARDAAGGRRSSASAAS